MKRSLLAIALILALPALACSTSTPASPTYTPQPTYTSPPADAPPAEPVEAEPAEAEPTEAPPAEPVEACALNDDFLADLKALLPYDEFALHHNIIGGTHSLVLWFVDSEIDPDADAETLEDNATLAIVHAAEAASLLALADPCVADLFDVINPIIVDTNYIGWFSGVIDPALITPNAGIDQVTAAFQISYLNQEPPFDIPAPPAGACTWADTSSRIHNHFAASRQNVAFYYIIDQAGINLWAQWDGPTDQVIVITNIMNILLELDCLYPYPTTMYAFVVDEQGATGMLMVIPSNEGVLDFENATVINDP